MSQDMCCNAAQATEFLPRPEVRVTAYFCVRNSVHGLKRILQQVGASDIIIEAQKVHTLQRDFVWPAIHAKR